MFRGKKGGEADIIVSLTVVGLLLLFLFLYPKSCLDEKRSSPSNKEYLKFNNNDKLNDAVYSFLTMSMSDAERLYVSADVKSDEDCVAEINKYKLEEEQMQDIVVSYLSNKDESCTEELIEDIAANYLKTKFSDSRDFGEVIMYFCEKEEDGDLDCYKPGSVGQILPGKSVILDGTFYANGFYPVSVMSGGKETMYLVLLGAKKP